MQQPKGSHKVVRIEPDLQEITMRRKHHRRRYNTAAYLSYVIDKKEIDDSVTEISKTKT
jgi:hypothetical protein